jgi:hypothetical protein
MSWVSTMRNSVASEEGGPGAGRFGWAGLGEPPPKEGNAMAACAGGGGPPAAARAPARDADPDAAAFGARPWPASRSAVSAIAPPKAPAPAAKAASDSAEEPVTSAARAVSIGGLLLHSGGAGRCVQPKRERSDIARVASNIA